LERSERVVRSKAEVVDCRKRTMPLPSERFLAVGSRSELGMVEGVQPGDYGSASCSGRSSLSEAPRDAKRWVVITGVR
jgi:hypothetical protein